MAQIKVFYYKPIKTTMKKPTPTRLTKIEIKPFTPPEKRKNQKHTTICSICGDTVDRIVYRPKVSCITCKLARMKARNKKVKKKDGIIKKHK